VEPPAGMEGLLSAEKFFTLMDPDPEKVKDFIRSHA